MLSVSLPVYLSTDKLAKHTKKTCFFCFSSSNLLLV